MSTEIKTIKGFAGGKRTGYICNVQRGKERKSSGKPMMAEQIKKSMRRGFGQLSQKDH